MKIQEALTALGDKPLEEIVKFANSKVSELNGRISDGRDYKLYLKVKEGLEKGSDNIAVVHFCLLGIQKLSDKYL